jgi:hypothetical protein
MIHARADKALEVYIGDQLVGWLGGPFCDFNNCSAIKINQFEHSGRWTNDDESLSSSSLTEESRVFCLDRRAFSFDSYKLQEMPTQIAEDLIARNIPLYAKIFKDSASDRIHYHWRAAMITQEDYEWLFDASYFEPADTEPDQSVVNLFGLYLANTLNTRQPCLSPSPVSRRKAASANPLSPGSSRAPTPPATGG